MSLENGIATWKWPKIQSKSVGSRIRTNEQILIPSTPHL